MDSTVAVKLEIEEMECIPEVTENDVYLDIAEEEEEIDAHLDTDYVKPSLTSIKQERASPVEWQWNPIENVLSVQKKRNNNNVTRNVGRDAKDKPSSKKTGAQGGHSDDEEVDVDTPYCGILMGQTQARSLLVADHPTPSFRRANFSSLFGSRSAPQKKPVHPFLSSATTSETSLFGSGSAPQKKPVHPYLSSATPSETPYNYNPQEWLKAKRNSAPVLSLTPSAETASSQQKGRNPSRNSVAKKSTAAGKPSRKNVSNVARKSTAKQSKPTQKPSNHASSKIAKKPVAKQAGCAARGHNSSAASDINNKLTNDHSTPAATKPVTSAFLSVARKSTSKPAQSYTSISNLHSQIVRSTKAVVDDPKSAQLYTSISNLHSQIVDVGSTKAVIDDPKPVQSNTSISNLHSQIVDIGSNKAVVDDPKPVQSNTSISNLHSQIVDIGSNKAVVDDPKPAQSNTSISNLHSQIVDVGSTKAVVDDPKPAQSNTSISNLHSQIVDVGSTKAVVDDPVLHNYVRPHSTTSQETSENAEHQRTELVGSDLDTICSSVSNDQSASTSTSSSPDKVSGFEKTQSNSTTVAVENSTSSTTSSGPSQGVQTVFTFVEKSGKKIECPECDVEIAQWSLKGHLQRMHDVQLKSCTKCKTGFTDLNLYSEHYAFHLQQEENHIAGILRSPFNAAFARQRMTRTQKSQFITKRKHSGTVTGQHHEASHSKSPSLHRNDQSPVKRPRLQSPKRAVSSLTTKSPSVPRSRHESPLSETSKNRTRTANGQTWQGSRSLLSNRGETLRERPDSLSSLLSEASSFADLAEPSSPFAQSKDSSSIDLEEQIGRQRASSHIHSPSPKRQRLEEQAADNDTDGVFTNACAEMSADERVRSRQPQSPSKATVLLVSLESASQPFNCRRCLKAFRMAMACPGAFRHYFQHRSSAHGPSAGTVHASPPGSPQDTPCAVDSNEDMESAVYEDDDADEQALASPPTVFAGQQATENHVHVTSGKDGAGTGGGFACKVCGACFQYHFELLRHALYHSYQFACGFCQKAYEQKGDLFDHFEIVHGGEMRFRCKYCKRQFEDLVRFQTHIKIHKDGTVVCCTMCNKKYSSSQQMLQHLKNSHGPCEVCGKKFLEEKQFVRHVQSAHMKHVHTPLEQLDTVHVNRTKQPVPKRFHCRWCSKVFQTQKGLLSHKRLHYRVRSTSLHGGSVQTEATAAQSLSNIATPKLSAASSKDGNKPATHARERRATVHPQPKGTTAKVSPAITKENKVLASLQGKRSQSSRSHSSAAATPGSMKCRVCHKQMHSLTALKSHHSHAHSRVPLPKHSRGSVKLDNLHSCPKCNKHFFSRSSICRHFRLAHGKTYGRGSAGKNSGKQKSTAQTCRKCGKNFGSKPVKTFLAHTKLCCAKRSQSSKTSVKHKEAVTYNTTSKNLVKSKPAAEKQGLFLCKICRACFTVQKSYKLHQVMRHKGKSSFFQCRICRKEITRGDNLDLHIRTMHEGRLPYLCRGCNVEFNTSKDIFSHKCYHLDISKHCKEEKLKPGQKSTETHQAEGSEYCYRCDACSIGFHIAREWTEHMQKHLDRDSKGSGNSGTDHTASQCEENTDTVVLEEYDSFPFLSGDEDLAEDACGTSQEQTESSDACKETTLSSDVELSRTGSTISESGQTSGSVEIRRTSHEHLTHLSADRRLLEEKCRQGKETGLASEVVQDKQDHAAGPQILGIADEGVNDSHVFERETVQHDLGVEDELSLSAFEDLYVTAWNSEYASDAHKSLTQAEGNVQEKATSVEVPVHSKPEKSAAVCLHSGEDAIKGLPEDASNGGVQTVEESQLQKEHDLCTEKDVQSTVVSYEKEIQQVTTTQEQIAGDEQASEECKCSEVISKTLKDAADSWKQNCIPADDVHKSQLVNIGGHQNEHVGQERRPGRNTLEDVTTVVMHQSKEPAQNEKMMNVMCEEKSKDFDSGSLKNSKICKTVFAEKDPLTRHKCDTTKSNTDHASVSQESSELPQTPCENMSLSEKAIRLISDSCESDQPSAECSKNQECMEEGIAQSQCDGVDRTATSTECPVEVHQSQAAKSYHVYTDTGGKTDHQKDTSSSVAFSKDLGDTLNNHGNQTEVSVHEEGQVQSKNEIKDSRNMEKHEPENQSKTSSRNPGELHQNEADCIATGVNELMNHHMLKCVTVLRDKLARRRTGEVTHASDGETVSVVQNLQEKSSEDDTAVKPGNKTSVDGHQLTGTQCEATRGNIFDVISSENVLNCPTCGELYKDCPSLHHCGVYKEQNDAHIPLSAKGPSTEQVADGACEHNKVSDGNLTKEKIGQSCSPPKILRDLSVSVSQLPYESVGSTLLNTSQSADEVNNILDKNEDPDSQNLVSKDLGQMADISDDTMRGPVVGEENYVPTRRNLPSEEESDHENQGQDRTDNANARQTDSSGEQEDNADCRLTSVSTEVCETYSGKLVNRRIKDSKGRLTEDEESSDKEDGLSAFADADGNEDMQNTQTGKKTRTSMAAADTDRDSMDKSSRMTEAKHEQRRNIFDMLALNCAVCPVCKKLCTEKQGHLECQRAPAEQGSSLSSFTAEQKAPGQEASFGEAAYFSHRGESGGDQYLPVGLVYIKKQSIEQQQNQHHTDHQSTAVSNSALCGSLHSVGNTPEVPLVSSVEKQNETALTQTAASSSARAESAGGLTIGECADESDMNKMTDKRDWMPDLNTHVTPNSPSEVSDKDSPTEKFGILARFMALRTDQKQGMDKENKNEIWDDVKRVNQANKSNGIVDMAKNVRSGVVTMDQPGYTGCRSCENAGRDHDHHTHRNECVQNYMMRLACKVSLKLGKARESNKEEINHNAEELMLNTQAWNPGQCAQENTTDTLNSSHRRRSSEDSDKPGKQDARSNIFDILSLNNHHPSSTMVYTSELADMNKGATNWNKQPAASHSAVDGVPREAQGISSKSMEYVNSTSVQNQCLHVGDQEAQTGHPAESELRKQLTELLLSNQQSSSSVYSSDSSADFCDSRFDRQDRPLDLPHIPGKTHSDPARHNSDQVNGPFKFLEQQMMMASKVRVSQPQHKEVLSSYYESETQDADPHDIGTSEQMPAQETDTVAQTECISSGADEPSRKVENKTSGGMQRYVQNLKKKLCLSEGLLSNRKGARHSHSADGPRRQSARLSHQSARLSQDENPSPNKQEKHSSPVRQRRSEVSSDSDKEA